MLWKPALVAGVFLFFSTIIGPAVPKILHIEIVRVINNRRVFIQKCCSGTPGDCNSTTTPFKQISLLTTKRRAIISTRIVSSSSSKKTIVETTTPPPTTVEATTTTVSTTSTTITTPTNTPPCLPHTCVTQLSLLDASNYINILNYDFSGNWWTAGSNVRTSDYFIWCMNQPVMNVSSDIKFLPGQPDNWQNNEHCMEMVVGTDTPPDNIPMNDVPCDTSYQTRYVCETQAAGCTFPECPTVPCLPDASKLSNSQSWQSNSDGVFRSACGRQYFISKVGKNWNDAQTECCKYGKQLLSVESFQELSCLAAMNKVQLKDTTNFYWTSGTNNGFGCEFTYGFCGSRTLLYQNFTNWQSAMPDNPLTERCLDMKMAIDPTQMTFNDQKCTDIRNFICEGSQPDCSPTCPSKSTCVKQDNFFNSKGELLDAFNYGRYASGTDKTYLFYAQAKVSWAEAFNFCCTLGMDLLSIATDQEMQDIFNLNNNNILLEYNSNFWTSGTQLNCNFHFNYCSTGTTFFLNDTKWNTDQPDNINELQWCVYSHFGTAASYSQSAAFIDDAPCSDLNNFICQTPKMCTSVPCYDYNCTVDPTKAAQVTAMSAAGWYGASVWTSGTDVGVGCLNKFGWCPSGILTTSELRWGAGEPNGPYSENCLNLEVYRGDSSATTFNDMDCSKSIRFLCEQPLEI
ncbi:Hypothetical predicted protein [Cloeon dipterum]|uniref:C-type lectin domain-containing protein n=1 Tax=Cloeon dipterum TaxID=197152 RepID=A0A8S1D0R6_9INSE|nr:Hypothetical predicted protein [Cloeon dipterum]